MGFVGSRYVPLEFGARVSTVRIWEFPKIRGTRFGGPYNKDPTIEGTIFGSPIFGNSQ